MTIPTMGLINFFSSQLYTGNSLSPFAPVTWEEEGKPKIVTNGDKGGRGVTKSHFCGDVIFERPLRRLLFRIATNHHHLPFWALFVLMVLSWPKKVGPMDPAKVDTYLTLLLVYYTKLAITLILEYMVPIYQFQSLLNACHFGITMKITRYIKI